MSVPPGAWLVICGGLLLAATLTQADAPIGSTSAPIATVAPHATEGGARKLDLALGDLTRYVDPALLEAPLPDDLEEIIVNGRKPEPLPEHKQLPKGLGAVAYALFNPTQAWRIVLPEPHAEPVVRDPDAPRTPPGAYRAGIPAPGRIHE